jgi:hypothetical protein
MNRGPKHGDLFRVDDDIVISQRLTKNFISIPVAGLLLIPAGTTMLCVGDVDGSGSLFEFLVDSWLRVLPYGDLDKMTLIGQTFYPASGTAATAKVTCRLQSLDGKLMVMLESGDRCVYDKQVSWGQTITTHSFVVSGSVVCLTTTDDEFSDKFDFST